MSVSPDHLLKQLSLRREDIIKRITEELPTNGNVLAELNATKDMEEHRLILRKHIKRNDPIYQEATGTYFRKLFHLEMELYNLENTFSNNPRMVPIFSHTLQALSDNIIRLITESKFNDELFNELDAQCNRLQRDVNHCGLASHARAKLSMFRQPITDSHTETTPTSSATKKR